MENQDFSEDYSGGDFQGNGMENGEGMATEEKAGGGGGADSGAADAPGRDDDRYVRPRAGVCVLPYVCICVYVWGSCVAGTWLPALPGPGRGALIAWYPGHLGCHAAAPAWSGAPSPAYPYPTLPQGLATPPSSQPFLGRPFPRASHGRSPKMEAPRCCHVYGSHYIFSGGCIPPCSAWRRASFMPALAAAWRRRARAGVFMAHLCALAGLPIIHAAG